MIILHEQRADGAEEGIYSSLCDETLEGTGATSGDRLQGASEREREKMKNRFMARAIELSIEGVQSGGGGPFGAVIVKDGEILGEGANQVTSTKDPTAHAEMLAIRMACAKLGSFELKNCELYTSCEPCPMCLGAIYWARLARVYFANTAEDAAKLGFDDSLIYNELRQAHTNRRIPVIQMMREEALAGFHAWEAKPNKILY